ncbi:DivIVA domain-containing protein [Bifidobacterium aesculapii]|uniref:DivIVA domain-containing protein n=1 Tax=Bifidobacterium aesculapii TaxID=1329411 RepID=UPI0006E43B5C|nr:DivIVA domain-containing protein [Bifidobacterium aesculapii]
MAQQSEAGIPRAGKRKWGYDPAQVDAFLERAHALYDSDGAQLTQRDIQNVSFDLSRGGYEIAQVDAALTRLERAVVDKQTAWEISRNGRIAWKAKTEELYREIVKHLDRAAGERFGSGKPHTPSYDRKQVDKLADQIADKAAAELGMDGVSRKDVRDLDKLDAEAVANAVFTQRRGRKGYDERQVDYFLNSCVELLSRIESFDRVGDYAAEEPNAGAADAPASAASPDGDGVAPLFSPDAQYRQGPVASEPDGGEAPVSYAPAAETAPAVAPAASVDSPVAGGSDASFDALSQAEQSLFSAPTSASPVLAPAVSVAPVTATPAAPVTAVPASMPAVAPAASAVNAYQPAAPAASYQPTEPIAYTPSPVPSSVTVSPVAAPAVTPAVSSAHEDAPARTGSLAALAHMAEVSQEMPAIAVPSFVPQMPKLDVPAVSAEPSRPLAAPGAVAAASTPAAVSSPAPAATPVAPVSAPASPAAPTAPTHTTNPFSLLSTDGGDLEIPDLSFPTFGDDDGKKQQ